MTDSVTYCPKGHRLQVVDSRPMKVGGFSTTCRRKRCDFCDYQIKTLELPIDLATEVLADDD